jgi:hypothetical protein
MLLEGVPFALNWFSHRLTGSGTGTGLGWEPKNPTRTTVGWRVHYLREEERAEAMKTDHDDTTLHDVNDEIEIVQTTEADDGRTDLEEKFGKKISQSLAEYLREIEHCLESASAVGGPTSAQMLVALTGMKILIRAQQTAVTEGE